jgi:hypothetical protein
MLEQDPYLQIAETTNFVDYVPSYASSQPLDFLLELTDTGASALRSVMSNPDVSINTAHLDAGSPFVTARMPPEVLHTLDGQGALQRAELTETLRHQRTLWPKTGSEAPLAQGDAPLQVKRSSPTLAAIIDDGCPFAHREFRRADGNGTRVVVLWDMDPSPELPFDGSCAPAGFCRGREVPGAVLDGWMAASTRNAVVDESACYTAARYSLMDADLTHGSHLLGRLAGSTYTRTAPQADAAAGADIAFVQLPRRAEEAPHSGSIHACILDALRYLRRFADANGYDRCVVACAEGSMLGPHDGNSLFERALSGFLAESDKDRAQFAIVFAAGNGYQDGVHAVLAPGADQSTAVAWVLPADNEAATFAELWSDTDPELVHFSLQVQGATHPLPAGSVLSIGQWLHGLRTGKRVTLRSAPTRTSDGTTPSATPGPVTIVATAKVACVIHAYACWGGRNIGYARDTRQAEWKLPVAGNGASIEPTGSLLGDACGMDAGLYVVGGYVGGNDPGRFERAKYSAVGPTRGKRPGPSFLALTETNSATRGIPGPGTRSGSTRWMWGTSVAAPQAARALINGETPPARNGSPLPPESEVGGGFLP